MDILVDMFVTFCVLFTMLVWSLYALGAFRSRRDRRLPVTQNQHQRARAERAAARKARKRRARSAFRAASK
jgi:hypothetical protein